MNFVNCLLIYWLLHDVIEDIKQLVVALGLQQQQQQQRRLLKRKNSFFSMVSINWIPRDEFINKKKKKSSRKEKEQRRSWCFLSLKAWKFYTEHFLKLNIVTKKKGCGGVGGEQIKLVKRLTCESKCLFFSSVALIE